jgi:hypothetical protein
MPKLNIEYQSLFKYLVSKDIPFARKINNFLYSDQYYKENTSRYIPFGRTDEDKVPLYQQFLGGLQPLADMLKDFVDTFKPYKIYSHTKRDAIQPFSGALNIAKGVGTLVITPLVFLINIIRYLYLSISELLCPTLHRKTHLQKYREKCCLVGPKEKSTSDHIKEAAYMFLHNIFLNFVRTVSWLLEGALNIIRGITQIIAAPLVWLIKIPVRSAITAINGFQAIENNTGIIKLINEAIRVIKKSPIVDHIEPNKRLDNRLLQYDYYNKASDKDKLASTYVIHIMKELHRKFTKSYNRGQKTNIIADEEAKTYRMVKDTKSPTHALEYLMLFRNPDSIIKNLSEETSSTQCSCYK